MDSYEPNSPPILQIRAYFGNKEHVFILQNPLHSSLRQFKEDLFELFIPHLSSKEDVSNFELKYLESSYLLPLENQEQFQNAMKYAQTQQPAFLHIFCSKQVSKEVDEEVAINPANIPLPEETDDELDTTSLVSTSFFDPILDSYIHNEKEYEQDTSYLTLNNNSSLTSNEKNDTECLLTRSKHVQIEEQSVNSIVEHHEEHPESTQFPSSKRDVGEESPIKSDKAIQSTPLASLNSKFLKKKAPSHHFTPRPWNPSINAKDLRNPEYETKLSLIDERSNLSPTKVSTFPHPNVFRSKKLSSSTAIPPLGNPSGEPSTLLLTSPVLKHSQTDASTKSISPLPPLTPINKKEDKVITNFNSKEQANQMETIVEEEKEEVGLDHINYEEDGTFKNTAGNVEEVDEGMEYFKEGAVTMEKEELRYESPSPSISSYAIPSIPFHQPPLARTSPKSVSRVEAEKPKQEYRELMLVPLPSSQVKCYKPTFKDPPHADGSSKHIQFIDPFLFPSTSIPPIPDPPKSILKKVSISDSAPSHSSSVTPSVGSLPTVDPAPNTPITLTPSTKEKKAMASPTYPSPSYVLVPANLLPSLFPVIPPIANYPWTSTEQQWGLPPRPKSMLEYVSHTKRTSPRPYSATPPLSYYEQYLLSRK